MKQTRTKIKIILALVLLVIGVVVFWPGSDGLKTVQKAAHNFLMMLQEFASKDIVGIV